MKITVFQRLVISALVTLLHAKGEHSRAREIQLDWSREMERAREWDGTDDK